MPTCKSEGSEIEETILMSKMELHNCYEDSQYE